MKKIMLMGLAIVGIHGLMYGASVSAPKRGSQIKTKAKTKKPSSAIEQNELLTIRTTRKELEREVIRQLLVGGAINTAIAQHVSIPALQSIIIDYLKPRTIYTKIFVNFPKQAWVNGGTQILGRYAGDIRLKDNPLIANPDERTVSIVAFDFDRAAIKNKYTACVHFDDKSAVIVSGEHLQIDTIDGSSSGKNNDLTTKKSAYEYRKSCGNKLLLVKTYPYMIGCAVADYGLGTASTTTTSSSSSSSSTTK